MTECHIMQKKFHGNETNDSALADYSVFGILVLRFQTNPSYSITCLFITDSGCKSDWMASYRSMDPCHLCAYVWLAQTR